MIMSFSAKNIRKYSIALLVIILLEFGYFQLDVWKFRIQKDVPKDLVFELKDMEPVNWTKTQDGFISEFDPMFVLPTDAMHLYHINCRAVIDPQPALWEFFYTLGQDEVQVLYINDDGNGFSYDFDIDVGPTIRIDPVSEPGTALKGISIEINKYPDFHISISRIVAMLVICMLSEFLMSLQKLPDYTKYVKGEGKK